MTEIQEYKIIINILLLMPFILITILYFFMKNKKWKVRYPIMILSGWAIFLIFVVSLTTYSVHYAPTKELMEIAANGDGAPNVFTLLFGWIYALVFLLFLEFVNKITSYIQKWFGKET
jgi:hypothetical protein